MESHADPLTYSLQDIIDIMENIERQLKKIETIACLLYTSPSPRD